MVGKRFQHSLLGRLNFIPGLIFISVLWYIVSISKSETQIYGYFFVLLGSVLFAISIIDIRKRDAKEIILTESGICARNWFGRRMFIKWDDVAAIHKKVVNWEMRSRKIQRTNYYAMILSRDGTKIIVKKTIKNYDELIRLIETRAGKKIEWDHEDPNSVII